MSNNNIVLKKYSILFVNYTSIEVENRQIRSRVSKHNIQNVQAPFQNHSLYKESGRSQTMKKNYRCQYWYDRDVRIIWQDFKATVITMFQWEIMNILETKGKIETLNS